MTLEYFHKLKTQVMDEEFYTTKPNKNSTIYPIPRQSGKTANVRGIRAQHIWFDGDIVAPYNVFSMNNVEDNYFRSLVEEDAPYYVQIMAPYYDLLCVDRPFKLSYEDFIKYRLKPNNRFFWSMEPRNDWELRTLLYLSKRIQDKKRLQALNAIFKELEGELE